MQISMRNNFTMPVLKESLFEKTLAEFAVKFRIFQQN
jgi:hypothetical protein